MLATYCGLPLTLDSHYMTWVSGVSHSHDAPELSAHPPMRLANIGSVMLAV